MGKAGHFRGLCTLEHFQKFSTIDYTGDLTPPANLELNTVRGGVAANGLM